jgi:uncharacterized protein (DUF2267 family)
MSVVATGFERAAEPGRPGSANDAHRLLRALLGALDRRVPPGDASRDAELPTEWFKYPPF